MRADRLLRLVGLLRRHGKLTAAQLADRLEVTERTVLRDIEALSASGVPVYAERGRHGGYALLPGYRPGVEDLTPDEARALFLAGGEGAASALGVEAEMTSALRKLAARLPEETDRELGRLQELIIVDAEGFAGAPPRLAELPTVQLAVLERRRLVLDYTPMDPSRRGRRTVDPYGLVLAGNTWYLLAAHRGQVKSFRVERINRATLLPQRAARPDGIDLRALWRRLRESYRDRPGIRIEVATRPDRVALIRRLMAMNLTAPIEETTRGGRTVLIMRVHGLREAVAVLLGLGDGVEALAPPALRAMMIRIAREATAVYLAEDPAGSTSASSGSAVR
ncbi:putative DNA-binding transcriptional regulator YafY [Naumannella cuiyingiana]|uniref:Putative DNA-binding transcriptional regulator YafY n=1 Tax=Naumannella cuiyingiana TaxID=1347891 RepID=A0A7Z0D7C9_9ACTN|nr:YafY family protein [Naumannella cuiyingiana]NYI70232.1 putative DNA-binding transcriptional regulator YafY [Naumannella cuiyingiana]